MAKQKLIITMTRTQISAAFLENGKPMPVSFDGNTKMPYEGEKDFQKFCMAVSDTFNLENLDGADMSAILVVCGAENEKANELNALLSKLQGNSMIRAEYVLPYILASRGELKKDAGQCVAILDSAYALKNNEKNLLECTEAEKSEENALALSANDFFPLFFVDASKFGMDEKLAQEQAERINALQDENQELLEKIQEFELDETERANAQTAAKLTVEQVLAELERRAEIAEKRSVVYWAYNSRISPSRRSPSYSFLWGIGNTENISSNLRFEFERTHQDGDMVNAGTVIGTVKVFSGKATVNYDSIHELTAKTDGQIFYQLNNSSDIGASAIVAVICDEADTKPEVFKWVKSVLPNYLP